MTVVVPDPRPLQPLQLLVVCTANQCRSPIGEALAAAGLQRLGQIGRVCSAGTEAVLGAPATPDAIEVARRRGLDLASHLSRPVTRDLASWANVIVTMERRHVVDLVTRAGAPLAMTFTLPELAGFAATHEPRDPDEDIDRWLARIAVERAADSALGGAGGAPEVADPVGESLKVHERAAAEIAELIDTVLGALYAPRTAVV